MGALVEYGALILIALVVAILLFVAVRAIAHGIHRGEDDVERAEIEVLAQRLARGEITQREYDEARRELGG